MDLQNIPAIYPEGIAAQQQAAQAQQIAGMAQASAAAQAAMPVSHRPMRQAGRQLRSTTQLHSVVEACQTVRIACMDEEGPFIVPMSFGYDWADPEEIDADAPRLALWVHSAGVGRKVDAFNREPRVAIEMDVQEGLITGTYACAYSYAYRSIMGTGTIHRIQGSKRSATASRASCSIWHPKPRPTSPTRRSPARTSTASTSTDSPASNEHRKQFHRNESGAAGISAGGPVSTRIALYARWLLRPTFWPRVSPLAKRPLARKPFCVCKLPTIAPDTRSASLCSRPTRRGRCRRSCR